MNVTKSQYYSCPKITSLNRLSIFVWCRGNFHYYMRQKWAIGFYYVWSEMPNTLLYKELTFSLSLSQNQTKQPINHVCRTIRVEKHYRHQGYNKYLNFAPLLCCTLVTSEFERIENEYHHEFKFETNQRHFGAPWAANISNINTWTNPHLWSLQAHSSIIVLSTLLQYKQSHTIIVLVTEIRKGSELF